ncbi:MAG: DUF4129 domain-containing protein [Pyrobaculum sp.]
MAMRHLLAVAVALLMFALVQISTWGPNPATERLAIDLKPAALRLSTLIQLAGTPEFRQYLDIVTMANNTQAQALRQLSMLVKTLDFEMSRLAYAVAQNNITEANDAYAKAKSALDQIKKTLTELGLWEGAKEYYTAAYVRLENYRQALEKKTPSNITLRAPQRVRAGQTITLHISVRPPNGTLLIYLNEALIREEAVLNKKEVSVRINVYKPAVVLTAVYIPRDAKYGPSRANATLNVDYLNTTVSLQCPPNVKWGSAVKINGTVTSNTDHVTLRVGKNVVNITTTNGTFSAVINSTDLTPGTYLLRLYVPPSGMYAPAAATCVLNITADPPPLNKPTALISGLPTALTPYFYYTPSILETTGPKNLTIYIPPHLPYSEATVQLNTWVINPVQIGAAFGLLAFFTATVLRRRPREPTPQPHVLEPTPLDYATLAAQYLRKTAQRLGISLTPGTTIRELIDAVYKIDQAAYRRIEKIGKRLEEVLYGGAEPREEDYDALR